MKILTVPAEIYVAKFKKHKAIKKNVLLAISKTGEHKLVQNDQQISNTDWALPKNFERQYWKIIEPGVKSFLLDISNNYGAAGYGVINYWFQQYKKGDYHGWHTHPESMYSCIYYVDMPLNTETVFKIGDKEVKFEISEGDIIAFPNCFLHCSKPNPTNKVKTVIAFNAFVTT